MFESHIPDYKRSAALQAGRCDPRQNHPFEIFYDWNRQEFMMVMWGVGSGILARADVEAGGFTPLGPPLYLDQLMEARTSSRHQHGRCRCRS